MTCSALYLPLSYNASQHRVEAELYSLQFFVKKVFVIFLPYYILCWSLYSVSKIVTNMIFLKRQKKKERNWPNSPPSEQTIFRTFMLMKINVTSAIIYMKNWETLFIRILFITNTVLNTLLRNLVRLTSCLETKITNIRF